MLDEFGSHICYDRDGMCFVWVTKNEMKQLTCECVQAVKDSSWDG
jgi:hypothetical protein